MDMLGVLIITFPFPLKTSLDLPRFYSNVSESLNLTLLHAPNANRPGKGTIKGWNVTDF
jgi:hypothetical protein